MRLLLSLARCSLVTSSVTLMRLSCVHRLSQELVEAQGLTLAEAVATLRSYLPASAVLVGQNVGKDVVRTNCMHRSGNGLCLLPLLQLPFMYVSLSKVTNWQEPGMRWVCYRCPHGCLQVSV
jgi:hypothetical protein